MCVDEAATFDARGAGHNLRARLGEVFSGDADEGENRGPEGSEHDDHRRPFDGRRMLCFGNGGSLRIEEEV